MKIVFFECEGGSDKGADGHRKDTLPMVRALQRNGVLAEILFYSSHDEQRLYEYVSSSADGYVSRVNPGTMCSEEEERYAKFLRRLANEGGLVAMPHPDTIAAFGQKDSLTKLHDIGLAPSCTKCYYNKEELLAGVVRTLGTGERVLKQNSGSTGQGIWRVQIAEGEEVRVAAGEPLPMDTKIRCTEAVDNHVEYRELGEFLEFCYESYIEGKADGQIVDMRFLPRIKEGEIRILFVGDSPVFVVHKKPAPSVGDAFSATLFSGAKYRYDDPSDWSELVGMFLGKLPAVQERLLGSVASESLPLIWTADFIMDWDENKNDLYYVGEFNCSCVGFTSHMGRGIEEMIAQEIMHRIEDAHARKNKVVEEVVSLETVQTPHGILAAPDSPHTETGVLTVHTADAMQAVASVEVPSIEPAIAIE